MPIFPLWNVVFEALLNHVPRDPLPRGAADICHLRDNGEHLALPYIRLETYVAQDIF